MEARANHEASSPTSGVAVERSDLAFQIHASDDTATFEKTSFLDVTPSPDAVYVVETRFQRGQLFATLREKGSEGPVLRVLHATVLPEALGSDALLFLRTGPGSSGVKLHDVRFEIRPHAPPEGLLLMDTFSRTTKDEAPGEAEYPHHLWGTAQQFAVADGALVSGAMGTTVQSVEQLAAANLSAGVCLVAEVELTPSRVTLLGLAFNSLSGSGSIALRLDRPNPARTSSSASARAAKTAACLKPYFPRSSAEDAWCSSSR